MQVYKGFTQNYFCRTGGNIVFQLSLQLDYVIQRKICAFKLISNGVVVMKVVDLLERKKCGLPYCTQCQRRHRKRGYNCTNYAYQIYKRNLTSKSKAV